MSTAAGPWIGFFDEGQRVIRHGALLKARYDVCANDLLQIIPTQPRLRLLDFGCGDALAATRYLEHGIHLTLYDGSEKIRIGLEQRYGHLEKIRVLNAEAFQALTPGQFHAITIHSVIQYISREQLPALLQRCWELLMPGGTLVLSDVLTPRGHLLQDALSLLTFGRQVNMLLPTLGSLGRAYFSSYRSFSQGPGLTRYADAELTALLRGKGFDVEILPANPGPFHHRRAFRAVKPASSHCGI